MVDYHLKNGEIFEGKYRVLEELGRGAFGTVYLAYQESMDRNIALKVLHPSPAVHGSNPIARFHREVKVISKLQHPNTVTIHEFGETANGVLYMVLEHVDGDELKSILKREGPLNAVRAANFAKQIARSLSEAHELGVVHRDLKPVNIMITKYGTERDFIKVLDFGVASLRDPSTPDLTGVNPAGEKNLIGTPRYMSPEQVQGEQLNGTSDIYSLGLILYEMLCGQPAVKGKTTMVLISQQISEKPLKLPLLAGHHPLIQEIIRTATAKRISDRFQTADQMSDALEAFIFAKKSEQKNDDSRHSPSKDETKIIPATSKAPSQNAKSEFLEKGTLVGSKYEIIKPIARGGFSVVYLAKFAGSDMPLAIKILDKNEHLDPVWVARFKREASLIRAFSHPNTVRILDFGEQLNFHYIAMEFVQGRSLFSQIRKHGALEARQIAEIILFVCGSLEEAHNKGVLHRDLKPSNIMLTETTEGFLAKVLDFGSAKLIDLNPGQAIGRTSQGHAFQQLTQQGVFVGTPRYAAPEQLLQETVDARVDIYGLGMVMWEALVGDPAVAELDYASCIELHLGPKPWMLPLHVNTPPQFADIVHRALQKKRENRYQDIGALAADLTRFLETVEDDSDLHMSISEVSDPFFDDPLFINDAIFGDITGLEHESDVPLLDVPTRVKPSKRNDLEKSTGPKDRAKAQNKITKKRESEPLDQQMQSIAEVENLELDTAGRHPKQRQEQEYEHEQKRKKKTMILPYIIALALLFGFVYLAVNSETMKENVHEGISVSYDNHGTLDYEFIVSALRSTGWILRQGDPLPYRDGVTLRTLIADKKGLNTTISVFDCTNSKQVKELQKLNDSEIESIEFGSTFIRWKKSDTGAILLGRTLFELKKLQRND